MGRVPMSPKEFEFWGKVQRGEIKTYREESWFYDHPGITLLLYLSIVLVILGVIFFFIF